MDGKDVRLAPMTAQMYHEYYREYRSDPDLCFDRGDYAEFVYDLSEYNGQDIVLAIGIHKGNTRSGEQKLCICKIEMD